jgi:hypothetical protein
MVLIYTQSDQDFCVSDQASYPVCIGISAIKDAEFDGNSGVVIG